MAYSGPIYTNRTGGVFPGKDCYAWFPRGGLDLDFGTVNPTPPAGFTILYPANSTRAYQYSQQFMWQIRVAAGTAPGAYTIFGVVPVTVVAAPAVRPVVAISVGDSVATMQAAIDAGNNLRFVAGDHIITQSLALKDGVTLSGSGAVLRVAPHGEVLNRMFTVAGANTSFTLLDLTLSHTDDLDPSTPTYIHSFPTLAKDVTIRGCRIVGGQLSQGQDTGWVVERCTFDRAGSGIIGWGSVFKDCRWIDPPYGSHCYYNTGVPSLLVSSSWDNTFRAVVYQTNDGQGFVAQDLHIKNQNASVSAGSECILFENGGNILVPNGPKNNTILDVHITGCSGPGLVWDGSGFSNNYISTVRFGVEDVGMSIVVTNGDANNNVFNNIQSTGRFRFLCYTTGTLGNISISNCQWIETVEGWGNASGPFESAFDLNNAEFPIDMDARAKSTGVLTISGCNLWKPHRIKVPVTTKNFKIRDLIGLPAGPYNP